MKFIGQESRLNDIYHNSWVSFKNLDLTGVKQVKVRTKGRGAIISVRSTSENGEELASINAFSNAPSDGYFKSNVKQTSGKKDLFFVFLNKDEVNILLELYDIEFIF